MPCLWLNRLAANVFLFKAWFVSIAIAVFVDTCQLILFLRISWKHQTHQKHLIFWKLYNLVLSSHLDPFEEHNDAHYFQYFGTYGLSVIVATYIIPGTFPTYLLFFHCCCFWCIQGNFRWPDPSVPAHLVSFGKLFFYSLVCVNALVQTHPWGHHSCGCHQPTISHEAGLSTSSRCTWRWSFCLHLRMLRWASCFEGDTCGSARLFFVHRTTLMAFCAVLFVVNSRGLAPAPGDPAHPNDFTDQKPFKSHALSD